MGGPQEAQDNRRFRRKIASALVTGGVVGASLGVGGTLLVKDLTTPPGVSSSSSYKPGGEWIQPIQRITVNSGVVQFRMEAYPTVPNSTPIQDVYVTDAYAGQTNRPWPIACRAVPLPKGQYPNEWGCVWRPPRAGDIYVAFIVQDKKGRVNSAPQGEHQIIEKGIGTAEQDVIFGRRNMKKSDLILVAL